MPMRIVSDARAAVREERQRHADDGQDAGHHPEVEERVPEDEAPDADREDRAEAILRLDATRIAQRTRKP